MTALQAIFRIFLIVPILGWSQEPPPAGSNVVAREWTSTDGKKITAAYVGVKNDNVALQLANGKTTFVPVSRLSAEDNAYLRANQFDYREAWQTWPAKSRQAMALVSVTEDKGDASFPGAFVYKTPHFRFVSDVDLGTALMKDLARVFELTYHLQAVSPLGTLAEPVGNGLFDAKLFGETQTYFKKGGPPSTAGVYLLKEKVFLAPLDLMGVHKGSTGWRKDPSHHDFSTIIHELTHMLTHGMLDNLPVWVNEGYAEYIASIPMERYAFMTSEEDIRNGVLDALINYTDRIEGTRKPRTGVLPKADRINFAKRESGPTLFKVENILMMNDVEWATGSKTPTASGSPSPSKTSRDDLLRMPKLYRTAHLIIYYFIQIEGEKGVLKIRRFLEENQKKMSHYHQYLADFESYETKMEAFIKLPGVVTLGDGKIQYPSKLTPPVAPKAPFTDPDSLKLGGVDALLGGESASAVGARVEAALVKDLGVKFRFE